MPTPSPYQSSIINRYKHPSNTYIPTPSANSPNSTKNADLSNLSNLSNNSKSILLNHGYTTINEVLNEANTSISNLASDLECNIQDTLNIINDLKACIGVSTTPTKDATAASLLFQNSASRSIITCCKSIDELLLGGIPINEITEIVGLPGVGKSQLCMQVCVDARIPSMFGGVSGEAIYIDTEGSFSPTRCFDMARALVQYVLKKKRKREENGDLSWYTVEDIMKGIHVFRVYNEVELNAVIHNLNKVLKKREELGLPVKVIVIDSIAFHYRVSLLS